MVDDKKIYSDGKFEKFSYADEVIRQMDRIGEFLPVVMSRKDGIDKYEVLAAYVAVRLLHSLVKASVYDKNYNPILDKLKEDVKKPVLEDKSNRLLFLDILLDAVDNETSKFGYVGLLPALDETVKHTTAETIREKANMKALNLAIEIVKKHGLDIEEFLKEEKPEQIKWIEAVPDEVDEDEKED